MSEPRRDLLAWPTPPPEAGVEPDPVDMRAALAMLAEARKEIRRLRARLDELEEARFDR